MSYEYLQTCITCMTGAQIITINNSRGSLREETCTRSARSSFLCTRARFANYRNNFTLSAACLKLIFFAIFGMQNNLCPYLLVFRLYLRFWTLRCLYFTQNTPPSSVVIEIIFRRVDFHCCGLCAARLLLIANGNVLCSTP